MEQGGRSTACDDEDLGSVVNVESGSVTTMGGFRHSGANNDDSETGKIKEDVIELFRVDTEESEEDEYIGFKGEAGGVKSPISSPLLPSSLFSLAGDARL